MDLSVLGRLVHRPTNRLVGSPVELIREMLLPEAWEENDDWSISGTDTYLLVKAPKSVQAKIPRMIDLIASMK